MSVRTPVLAVLLAASFASSAVAGFIVRDTFTDADRTDPAAPVHSENGVDADADGDLESAWYYGGSSSAPGSLVATAGNLRMTNATSSTSFTTHFTPEASKVNLQNVGDQMKLTWRFVTGDVNAANTSQNFRIALVNTPVGGRLAADGAPGSGAYTGYSLFANMAETAGNSNPFQLRERSVASGDLLGSSGNWSSLANGMSSGSVGYADNTEYTLEMLLVRTASGLDITATMSGGNIGGTGVVTVANSDATPSSYSYDTFALRPSNSTTTADFFDTRYFAVEFNPIPEPATLTALAAAGLMALRRRH